MNQLLISLKNSISLSFGKMNILCIYKYFNLQPPPIFLATYLSLISRLETCMHGPFTKWPKRNVCGVRINYCSITTKLEVFSREMYRIFVAYTMRENISLSSKSPGEKRTCEMRAKQFCAALSYI